LRARSRRHQSCVAVLSMRRPRLVITACVMGALVISLAAATTWAWFAYPLPTVRPAHPAHVQLLVDGQELAMLAVPGESREAPVAGAAEGAAPIQEWIPLSRIPTIVRAAVIAAEDQRFMRHVGVDLLAIAHAVVSRSGESASLRGASTITQQLARS